MSLEYQVERFVCWTHWTVGVVWHRFQAMFEEPPGLEVSLYLGPLSFHLTIWDRAEG